MAPSVSSAAGCVDNERTRHNCRQSTFLLGHLLLPEGKRPQHSGGRDEFMLFIISGLRRESEEQAAACPEFGASPNGQMLGGKKEIAHKRSRGYCWVPGALW